MNYCSAISPHSARRAVLGLDGRSTIANPDSGADSRTKFRLMGGSISRAALPVRSPLQSVRVLI